MVARAKLFRFDAQSQEPVLAETSPVVKPFQICAGLAEEFQLHLLKLTGTEGKVSGRDLIPEALADLADSERNLLAGGPLHILKVYENPLGGLRTEIDDVLRVLRYALEGLEHQIELTDIRKIMLAAGRAGNGILLDKLLHLALAHGVYRLVKRDALLLAVILDQFIRTEPFMAFPAVHKGI